MPTRIVTSPLAPSDLLAAVASPHAGATALFVGTVRDVNDGRAVSGLEYSAYRAMAEREIEDIVRETADRFAARVEVQHRVGMLAIGDTSVVIAASSPHRAAAFEACRHAIEELKRRVPIWKREQYVSGDRSWVGAGSGALTGDGLSSGAAAEVTAPAKCQRRIP